MSDLTSSIFDDDDEDDPASDVFLPLAKDTDQPIPAMRDVEPKIASVSPDGQALQEPGEDDSGANTVVVLEDPDGLAPKAVILSTMAYALATLFNGKRSATEIAEVFNERYRQELKPEQALELQRELDKSLFLQSRRFERTFKKQLHAYLDKDVRPPAHAGTAYPAEPVALTRTIENFFTSADGPDAGKSAPSEMKVAAQDKLRAVVVPHIDLRVGGATYAHAYKEILTNSQAEVFIILGVAHQNPGDILFNVSTKDFATPFGPVVTEKELAKKLQAKVGGDLILSELAHRSEHSIEFQAVLLASLMGERKRPFTIVPILCGGVERFLVEEAEENNPMEAKAFTSFCSALRKELDALNKKWCVLCSVDMSHVGPEFNHSTMISERQLPAIERGDMKLLQAAEKLDPEKFFAEVARTQNSRHVDAVIALLAMLTTCSGKLKTARLLHYDQMLKKNSHSAVSYAAMAFES
jgi:AmmeMemoRadiSam system protein B